VIELLTGNPLLTLFVVAAVGYPVGRIRFGAFRLGVAAVLFVGLALGALDPELTLPDVVYRLGLVLFVYTIGLAGGPHFVTSLRRGGLRQNGLVLAMLGLATVVVAGAATLLGVAPAKAAGLFAGALTNTPALAGLMEILPEATRSDPVVAYAVAYPVGVVGVLAAIFLMQRRWRTDYPAEAVALGAGGEPLAVGAVRVSRPDVATRSIEGWRAEQGWHVLAGRHLHEGKVEIADPHHVLAVGDVLGLIGPPSDVAAATAFLGEPSHDHPEWDRSTLDARRVFVSSPEVAGRRLRELDLSRYGALVTRVRRGDVDLLADPDMRLDLGDRVRVLAPRERIEAVSRYFGDSYRALSEVDVVSLGLGLALGLALGEVPIPLPGGATFELGLAGGPLLMALLLGTVGRTGPILWQLPYNANLTLRQLGLILFLAGVGVRSGWSFAHTVASLEGLTLFLVGALLTTGLALLTLWIGHRRMNIPMSTLTGLLAGQQTQPAVLAFAGEQTGNDLPTLGYATVFPVATLAKILLAQALLALLGGA
jgi:putative transport protein